MSGNIPVNYRGQNLFICAPNIDKKLKAEEIYNETYYTSLFNETIHDDDILSFIVKAGFWTQKDAEDIIKAEADIDNFKVALYNCVFQSNTEKVTRSALQLAKAEYNRLYTKRHQYDFLTPGGIAHLAKTSYLVVMSTIDEEGNPVANDFLSAPMNLVNFLLEEYNNARPTECQLRRLARTEPWRSYWNVGKREGCLFGTTPLNYSEDQRLLVLWSSLYDSVYDSAECPSDIIVEDDDILDGWLISQRRKAEDDKVKKRGESAIQNERIKNSGEIFVVAQTLEDAKRVDSLNDTDGKMRRKQKLENLRKFGPMAEGDMPDVKMDLQMRLNQMFVERMKR